MLDVYKRQTLFRLLFRDRNRLLSLYNAVNGTSCSSPEDLTVVTLENAVYMNMKNDVAFLVDFQLNLYEHQSTWNPNMPLRNLFYAAKEYQVLTRDQSLYAPQLVKIPTPNFGVFYNGDKEIDVYKRQAEGRPSPHPGDPQRYEDQQLSLIHI